MKKIYFVGDFLSETDSQISYKKIRDLFLDADEVICNFEGVFKKEFYAVEKAGPVVFQSPKALETLSKIGISAITACNNHMFDYGEKALKETKEVLRSASILITDDRNKDQIIPKTINNKGVTLIEACETHPVIISGQSKDLLPDQMRLFSEALIERIKKSKNDKNWIIVSVHAGLEQMNIPLLNIRERYKELIDAGADLIIGHHPHVPQGFESYMGKLIFYSLGNFYFHRSGMNQPNINGIAVSVEFDNHNLKCKTYRIGYDQNKKEMTYKADDLNNLNLLINDEKKYIEMIDKASYIHRDVFEISAPFISRRSFKGWIKLFLNILLRPRWLLKRRVMISDLVSRNESYIGLKLSKKQ